MANFESQVHKDNMAKKKKEHNKIMSGQHSRSHSPPIHMKKTAKKNLSVAVSKVASPLLSRSGDLSDLQNKKYTAENFKKIQDNYMKNLADLQKRIARLQMQEIKIMRAEREKNKIRERRIFHKFGSQNPRFLQSEGS